MNAAEFGFAAFEAHGRLQLGPGDLSTLDMIDFLGIRGEGADTLAIRSQSSALGEGTARKEGK